jgi:hypothetical protein
MIKLTDPKDYVKDMKKSRFEISKDELEYRMDLKKKLQEDPIKKAVALLELAMEKVLTQLGVDCTKDIIAQQDELGITIQENTDERTPQLHGFFIYVGYEEFIPFAWVGGAYLRHGRCYCNIEYFGDQRLEEIGGIKLA